MNLRFLPIRFSATFILLAFSAKASADNIDLVTLPTRETVQLTIYNTEDITLAKETRQITLKKGPNRLQFSWAGTLIDPTSVALRPLAHAKEIEVADTVFPGEKPQHLFWNIDSKFEGQVPVEVSYFTSGLTWTMDYTAISGPDETKLDFQGFVRVFNNSGEEYENAQIRLIVGKINLVEKIAELAKRLGYDKDREPLSDARSDRLQLEVLRESISKSEMARDPSGGVADGKKQIVKEGVSEYFMFSIAGEETIQNGWSKRMSAVTANEVEFEIVYRMREHQYGPRPVRLFIWRNDEQHHLGESPLPNGVVRLFRHNGHEGLTYLGQQSLEYVPIQAEIEVNLGPDDLVVYERRKTKSERMNFEFHPENSQVIGWDERQARLDTVRNYHDKPIQFELRLQIDGDVEFTSPRDVSSFDYRTVEMKLAVEPRATAEVAYELHQRHASRAKQNRLRLEGAK